MNDYLTHCVSALAAQEPTPFYLLDLASIKKRAQHLQANWRRFFPNLCCAYSYKTNGLRAVTTCLREVGMHAEVVSGLELNHALSDGYRGNEILFDGPLKRPEELNLALQHGVLVQADSLDELDKLHTIATHHANYPRIGLRLATCYRDSQTSRFGFGPAELPEAIRRLGAWQYTVAGLHCHVGSNVNDPAHYIRALDQYRQHITSLIQAHRGPSLFRLDIGGGFPAHSLRESVSPNTDVTFARAVERWLIQSDIDPRSIELVIEPGRCLVEDFGYLVTSVHARKMRNEERWLVVDAGLHLVRSRHNWTHDIAFVAPYDKQTTHSYRVYGANCFESDLLGAHVPGPPQVSVGDLLVITECGGYDIPSANVWTRPSPAIYGVEENDMIRVVRRAQLYNEVRSLEPCSDFEGILKIAPHREGECC